MCFNDESLNLSKKKYIEIIKELKNFGIKQVIFMDTAGYFLPYHFDEILEILNH